MGSEGIGTGLLVAEDRVLTNRHVFDRIKGPATFDLEPEPSSQARAGLELGEAVPIENSLQVDVALMEVVRTDVPEPVSWSTVAVDGSHCSGWRSL